MKNIVVLDVEFNGRRSYLDSPLEIISIGAIRIAQDDLMNNKLGDYQIFYETIKPVYQYTRFAEMFTGIPYHSLLHSDSFPTVIKRFIKWIGTNYTLVAWSMSDAFALMRDCKFHAVNTEWIKNYLDLQHYVKDNKKASKNKQVSLKKAMELFNIGETTMTHHALHDSFNTAQLLVKLYMKRLNKEFPVYQFTNSIFSQKEIIALMNKEGYIEKSHCTECKKLINKKGINDNGICFSCTRKMNKK